MSAIAGLCSPFFQKVFVDRLLGAPAMVHGWSGFSWFEIADPMLLIFLAFVCTAISQGLSLLSSYTGLREGLVLQREFSERLYRKMLSVKTDSMSGVTVGEVVSIYATDVPGSTAIVDQTIPMIASIVFPLVFAPLAIKWLCGIPLGATVTLIVAIVILNAILGTKQSRFFYRFKQLAAERTGVVNEWIQNIRLLRILGWTETFEAKIFKKRKEETRNRVLMVTNGQMMGAVGSSINFVLNLVGTASLVFLRAEPVSPGELFALLWIFGVFLARPFRQIPWVFTFSLDSLSSMRRLQSFLERGSDLWPDASSADLVSPNTLPAPISQTKAQAVPHSDVALDVVGLNLSATGMAGAVKPLLRDICFSVQKGEFVGIVGEVGSGKSLLVMSLVGETQATFSALEVDGANGLAMDLNRRRRHFAFVPQEGFVMSASLRDNIAFRYQVPAADDEAILHSLESAQFDLATEHVANGLNAEIGERGVNLSGGQRQRVSLARAHYFARPIILLDDCLSAVDVDTENLLIQRLIDGEWRACTRLLVTHRLSVLSKVDRILFMEDGQIIDSGTFSELLARSEKMRNFVASVRRGEHEHGSPPPPHEVMEDSNVALDETLEVELEHK